MRRTGIGTVVLFIWLAAAPAALAATVSMDPGAPWTLRVAAAPGERNDIEVTTVLNGLRVRDAGPVEAGPGCMAEPGGTVICREQPVASPGVVRIDAGDLDDFVAAFLDSVVLAHVAGGEGDDRLRAGDASPTTFTGGPGDDTMRGGIGRDMFLEGDAANGRDLMEGDGFDTVSYAGRATPVRADLDSDRDDGAPGERDLISSSIGNLVGGDAADVLVGNAGANALTGGRGRDLLSGRAADDRLRGGRGRDLLRGGRGRDRVIPGPGADRANAGPGNDVIHARDFAGDIVHCGRGRDRVLADFADVASLRGCEAARPRLAARR